MRGRRERGERYQKKHCGQTGHWLCEFRAFRRVTPLLQILCGSGASHVTRLGGPWQPEAMPFAGCCRGGGWGGHPPDGPHGPLRWTRSSATRLFWRRSCVGLRTLGARKASSGLSFNDNFSNFVGLELLGATAHHEVRLLRSDSAFWRQLRARFKFVERAGHGRATREKVRVAGPRCMPLWVPGALSPHWF